MAELPPDLARLGDDFAARHAPRGRARVSGGAASRPRPRVGAAAFAALTPAALGPGAARR